MKNKPASSLVPMGTAFGGIPLSMCSRQVVAAFKRAGIAL